MKRTKKLFAIALTLIMALALTVPAFAADITITSAQKGETYTAYKIFDYTKSGTNFAYTMDADSEWASIVENYTNAASQDVFTLTVSQDDDDVLVATINDGVTFASEAEAAHFADYLSTRIPTFAADSPVAPIANTANDAGVVSFTNLSAGYYFVDTSLGSLCSLFNWETEQELKEKNAEPTIDKKISATAGNYADDAISVSIGDTVYYQITVTDGIGTDAAITVHDVMEDGLSLNDDSFAIKVDGADVLAANYSINEGATHGEGDDAVTCEFEIVFDAEYVKSLADSEQIVITYNAVLNGDAEIAAYTNDNTAWLTYSAQESAHDTVQVLTYKFDLVKTVSDANGKAVLDGAQFKLYDAAEGGNEIAVVKVEDGLYRIAMDSENGDAIEAGYVTIKGLKGDTTYYLEETVAPAGYNKLTAREPVAIDKANLDATVNPAVEGEGDAAGTPATYVEGGIRVINLTGVELPSTGGIGTTIFYVVGALLMVGAGVLLVTKKRMADEE